MERERYEQRETKTEIASGREEEELRDDSQVLLLTVKTTFSAFSEVLTRWRERDDHRDGHVSRCSVLIFLHKQAKTFTFHFFRFSLTLNIVQTDRLD